MKICVFSNIPANYIFYGHEHTFSHFKDSNTEYICLGSLIMKYLGHYTIIDIDEYANVEIVDKLIKYDVKKYKSLILKANYPRAENTLNF